MQSNSRNGERSNETVQDFITPIKTEKGKNHRSMYKSNTGLEAIKRRTVSKASVNSTKRKLRKSHSRRRSKGTSTGSSVRHTQNPEIVPHNLQLDLSKITMKDTSFVAKLAQKEEDGV